MLQDDADAKLFVTYEGDVLDQGTKDAYAFLVGWGAASQQYACCPGSHGYIKDVRYMVGDAWYFSFVPNQQWLLFYFRKPCLGVPKYSRANIMQHFPAAKETSGGEFTVRVASLQDALRVARYIEN